jgi:beta-phosphoglucomutase
MVDAVDSKSTSSNRVLVQVQSSANLPSSQVFKDMSAMDWIQDYQLFLFDFDGLLVDTEPLHYASYAQLCLQHGCEMKWDFERFCQEAHGKAMGIWEALMREFPHLFVDESSREVLYEEKKTLYVELLKKRPLEFMEGAAELLAALDKRGAKRAVVTNSPRAHIEVIKESLPLLKSIPLWITREDYSHPKPSPEGYLKAIEHLAGPGDKIIGFEDTLKGLKALLSADVESILICPSQKTHVKECVMLGAKHFESLLSINRLLA